MFSKLLHVLWNRNYEDTCTTGEGKKNKATQGFFFYFQQTVATWPISYKNMCSTNQSIFATINSILLISLNIYNTDFQGKIHKR